MTFHGRGDTGYLFIPTTSSVVSYVWRDGKQGFAPALLHTHAAG